MYFVIDPEFRCLANLGLDKKKDWLQKQIT